MPPGTLESARSALPPLDGVSIREATTADNEALLELTRATPMAGTISLRIDRDPDFFALLRARGDFTLFVAEHTGLNGTRIIGCMSSATYPAYIEGRLETIAHAGDLKVHPEFTGRRLALHLVSAVEHHLRSRGVDLSFNLVADGNHKVMTIAQGKHGTPVQTMLGRFLVDEMIPSPFRLPSRRYAVAPATSSDLDALMGLLTDFASARNFARPPSLPDLKDRLHCQTPILVARDKGTPVATITLDDTSHLRRNVPVSLPRHLRLLLPILGAIPGIRPPELGEPIRMLYLRHLGCLPDHIPALRALVAEARLYAFRQRASFVSLGLHERDPLRAAITGIPRFTFTSRAMATSLLSHRRVESLLHRVPYEDFALI